MTVVVLGIDALDPDLVDPEAHPNLVLEEHGAIETIVSSSGDPSTHELWPTIITGLAPTEHGLELDDGVAWESPLLRWGSGVADYLLPSGLQSRVGAWLLTNTDEDAFREPASYYDDNDIPTVFDGRTAKSIGIPNYVVDPDEDDREHDLRRHMGDLFERDPEATGGHTSADPHEFYEQCLEMAMVRIARARRALRGGRHELVFAYTSGLDLIGHVTYDLPDRQMDAYDELDEFVGDLREDLRAEDELVLVSDHGLQDGTHTEQAMIAATSPAIVSAVDGVRDVKDAIEAELARGNHDPKSVTGDFSGGARSGEVREHLEDLGYM